MPEQDPHAIEVKPAQLARLRAAALLVRVGLDHEPWLARLPPVKLPVLDVSKDVKLLQTETPRLRVERTAHVHAYGNTHYWLDPTMPGRSPPQSSRRWRSLARGQADFRGNRAAFLSRLDDKIAEWEKALMPYRGTKVVVVHDSWAYFAERFGLQIVAAAEPNPGIPPSPAELAALFKRMRESGVRVLIAEPIQSGLGTPDRGEGRRQGRHAIAFGIRLFALFDENV